MVQLGKQNSTHGVLDVQIKHFWIGFLQYHISLQFHVSIVWKCNIEYGIILDSWKALRKGISETNKLTFLKESFFAQR